MGRISEVIVGENVIATFKCSDTSLDDNDINKPVKLSASDTVALAADGEVVYGFIDSVDPHTEDGVPVVGVQITGRKWVLADGTYAVGDIIEGATNTAAGVANAGDFGLVSTKSDVAADLADDASGALIAASVNALLAEALTGGCKWKVIYGAGTDGSEALIELVA